MICTWPEQSTTKSKKNLLGCSSDKASKIKYFPSLKNIPGKGRVPETSPVILPLERRLWQNVWSNPSIWLFASHMWNSFWGTALRKHPLTLRTRSTKESRTWIRWLNQQWQLRSVHFLSTTTFIEIDEQHFRRISSIRNPASFQNSSVHGDVITSTIRKLLHKAFFFHFVFPLNLEIEPTLDQSLNGSYFLYEESLIPIWSIASRGWLRNLRRYWCAFRQPKCEGYFTKILRTNRVIWKYGVLWQGPDSNSLLLSFCIWE